MRAIPDNLEGVVILLLALGILATGVLAWSYLRWRKPGASVERREAGVSTKNRVLRSPYSKSTDSTVARDLREIKERLSVVENDYHALTAEIRQERSA